MDVYLPYAETLGDKVAVKFDPVSTDTEVVVHAKSTDIINGAIGGDTVVIAERGRCVVFVVIAEGIWAAVYDFIPGPWWEWNGVDITQFTSIVGSDVSDSSVTVETLAGVPWIKIYLELTGSGSTILDDSLLLLINDPPPYLDYYLVADILMDSAASGDSAIIGVRGKNDFGMIQGYASYITFTPTALENRLYNFASSFPSALMRQQLEETPFDGVGSPGLPGGTYTIGAEGGDLTGALVKFGGPDNLAVVDNSFSAVLAANTPFVGAYGPLGPSVTVYLSNIRAYTYRSRRGVSGGGGGMGV